MAAYYIKVAGGEENFENEWNPLEFSSLAYYDWPIEPVVSKSEEIDLKKKKKKKKGRKMRSRAALLKLPRKVWESEWQPQKRFE